MSKTPQPTPTQKTSPKSSTPKAAKAQPEQASGLLEQLTKLLEPLIEMQRVSAASTSNDLTVSWTMNVMREGELFAQTSGITTMPGILSELQLPMAPEQFTEELLGKIILPAAHVLQALANQRGLEVSDPTPKLEEMPLSVRTSGLPLLGQDDDLSVEAEIISGASPTG
jgi:hypothetical protein